MPTSSKLNKTVKWIEREVDHNLLKSDMPKLLRILKLKKAAAICLAEIERLIDLELATIEMLWAKSVIVIPVEDKTVMIHLTKDEQGKVNIELANNDQNYRPGIIVFE